MSQTNPPKKDDKETTTASTFWNDYPLANALMTPGNVLLLSSIPFCYRSYSDYRKYSDMIARQRTLPSNHVIVDEKLGMKVASRALGIATRGNLGLFALTGSFLFFVNGWSSMTDAVHATERWAQSRRQRVMTVLGIPDRNADDHPDGHGVEAEQMTEEQKVNYHLAKEYFEEASSDNRERDSSQ